ncbi:conserved hypothetical protein, partial [sediment metagenome]
SLPDDGDAGDLKTKIFEKYCDALKAEKNPVLRESMVFNLYYAKELFAENQQAKIDELYEIIAPSKPPYTKWFKDGKKDLKISWRSGTGDHANDEFLKRDSDALIQYHGFKMVTDEYGHRVLKKEFAVDGKQTKVTIDFRVDNCTMFDNMDDPDTGIVVYAGHSDIGRNIRNSMANAQDQQGAKLLFIDLCSGKDGLFRMRDRYPDAQVVTTFDSSYYGWGEAEGGRAFNAMLEGIAARSDWKALDEAMKGVVGWGHALDRNYLTPIQTLVRRRLLDTDHDGQADVLDRLVDFNLMKPEMSTENEFSPVKPNHPINKLDGINVQTAAMTINTLVGYNTTLESLASLSRVVADGFFVPAKGEEDVIVKFIEDKDQKLLMKGSSGTATAFRMKINGNFAHMSEEVLRTVTCYEFNKLMAETYPEEYFDEGDWPEGFNDQAKARLMGLVFAASNLVFDMNDNYWSMHPRDKVVWDNLLKYVGVPDIDPEKLFKFIYGIGSDGDTHHDYTGSTRVLSEFLKMLTPDEIEALKQ